MSLITLLKLAFKQALLSGRVYRLSEYADPAMPGALPSITDYSAYHRPLSPQLWAAFQDNETAFRAGLNTRPWQEKHFACSGDPGEWIRLIKILYGVFFKNSVFTTVSARGKPLGVPFLTYVTRILKKFPLYQPLPEPMTSSSAAAWIEGQLCFIRNTVQPQLCIRTQERRSKKVSRNKLASLWQHRRSKAIQIILNNSEYPDTPPCPSDITVVKRHYENKCQSRTSISDPLPSTPWSSLPPIQPNRL